MYALSSYVENNYIQIRSGIFMYLVSLLSNDICPTIHEQAELRLKYL